MAAHNQTQSHRHPQTPDTSDVGPPTDRRIKAILDRVPTQARVLDIGCVNHDADSASDQNWLHKHLYRAASHVTGIDILEDDVATLQNEGYNAVVGNAETFDLDADYDCIVAGEIIEHLSNPGAFLDRARDHLADDGRLILTTPNPWGVSYLKRTLTPGEVHCNEEHTGWFDRRTLRQMVERHGFDVVEHEYCRPPIRRGGHGEYLAWSAWHVFKQRRLAALDHLLVAEPKNDRE